MDPDYAKGYIEVVHRISRRYNRKLHLIPTSRVIVRRIRVTVERNLPTYPFPIPGGFPTNSWDMVVDRELSVLLS